jgi:hypothetical protein
MNIFSFYLMLPYTILSRVSLYYRTYKVFKSPVNLHVQTSDSSSTTKFPWLTLTLQSNSQLIYSTECLQNNSTARTTYREHMSRVRYPTNPLARGLDLQTKTHHVTAIQLIHWRADCCLATSYNICSIVACAYGGVFTEPLPSNAWSKTVTIFSWNILSVTILDSLPQDIKAWNLIYILNTINCRTYKSKTLQWYRGLNLDIIIWTWAYISPPAEHINHTCLRVYM